MTKSYGNTITTEVTIPVFLSHNETSYGPTPNSQGEDGTWYKPRGRNLQGCLREFNLLPT